MTSCCQASGTAPFKECKRDMKKNIEVRSILVPRGSCSNVRKDVRTSAECFRNWMACQSASFQSYDVWSDGPERRVGLCTEWP
jgi:hypothetical protein